MKTKAEPPDKVIFRKWKDGGQIIALFPRIATDRNGYFCQSYMHVGQHGSADYNGVIWETKRATKAEYASLKRELESEPFNYRLKVALKSGRADFEARKASL